MATSTPWVVGKTNIWGVFAGVVAENVCEAWGVVKMGQVCSVEASLKLNDKKVSFDPKNSTILDQIARLI